MDSAMSKYTILSLDTIVALPCVSINRRTVLAITRTDHFGASQQLPFGVIIGGDISAILCPAKTEVADGDIYSRICDLAGINTTEIGQCLDEIVPCWLSWAKEIFKFFVLFLG